MSAALELAPHVGLEAACDALGVSRATIYRRRAPAKPREASPATARALSEAERTAVLQVLNAPRFQDASPAEVYASLLDEGAHLASISTMYRLLRQQGAVRERRAQRPPHALPRPELAATGPNQVWSWDITKVLGPERRQWFHLYVVLDIFSRYVVGWLLAASESAALAERLLADTLDAHEVAPGQLTLHADRGTSMRSKTVAELLADLGVNKSHSRPRTSNDNPYSEAQFKTTKYSAFFPGRFYSLADGRSFFDPFFAWYNNEHHHSGIAMLTPATVHYGRTNEVVTARQAVLDRAWQEHPDRFINGRPLAAHPPPTVWINRPTEKQISVTSASAFGRAPTDL